MSNQTQISVDDLEICDKSRKGNSRFCSRPRSLLHQGFYAHRTYPVTSPHALYMVGSHLLGATPPSQGLWLLLHDCLARPCYRFLNFICTRIPFPNQAPQNMLFETFVLCLAPCRTNSFVSPAERHRPSSRLPSRRHRRLASTMLTSPVESLRS